MPPRVTRADRSRLYEESDDAPECPHDKVVHDGVTARAAEIFGLREQKVRITCKVCKCELVWKNGELVSKERA